MTAPLKAKDGEPQPEEGIMKEYLTPCSPGDPDAREGTWETIDGSDLLEVSVEQGRQSTKEYGHG